MGTSFFYPYLRDFLPSSIFQSIWLNFLIPSNNETLDPILQTKAFCMNLSSPIGISSGFDINAVAFSKLLNLGSGFVELGPVLPSPEGYSLSPYSITENSLQITGPVSSFGVNSIKNYLKKDSNGPRGVNLLLSKQNMEIIPHMTDDDYKYSFMKLYHLTDFFTINLSQSEFGHTNYYERPYKYENLIRKLTEHRNFEIGLFAAFQSGLLDFVDIEPRKLYTPIYIKINASWNDIEGLVEKCVEYGIDGLIVGDENDDPEISRKVLEKAVKSSNNRLEIISFGGVNTGIEVLERIKTGAKAVQICNVLLCKGPWELKRIHQELTQKLREENFKDVESAFNFYNRKLI